MSAGVSDQRRKGPGHQGGYTQNGDNNKYGMSSSNNGSGYHGGNNYQNSSNNVSWANQVNRSNDGYQHHAPPRPINSNRSGDDLRDLDQGVKGLSFNNGQQGDRKKSDGGGASKKMTWATVASQPAKPQVTTTSLLVKKKGKGMPPPPMVPGKHNLDIGSWDTAVRDPTPPPSPPTPPPVEPTPIPLNAQHQQAIEREEQQLKQQQQRNQHQNGQGGGHYDGGRRDHHNYQQNNRDGYNNNNGYNNYREKRSWNNNQGPPQQNYHERPNGGAPGGGGAGNNRPMQQNYNNGGGYAGGGGGRGNYHGGQHRDHNGYNNQPRSVSPTQQQHQHQPQQYHRREAPHSPVQQHHRDHGLEDREQLSPGRHEEPPQHHQHYGGRSAKVSVSDTEEPELTREMIDKLMDKNNYNPPQLQLERGKNARFFVIKSYSEDDIHRSIKYEIWCSTEHGNKRLDQAYREREQEGGNVLLFFSVNGSGHFCGIAEMISAVDYNSKSTVWAQDKWRGVFKVKWIYVKDVPNQMLRQIRLENNENKPVTNSRDTQEVPNPQGLQMLEIIHGFQHTTSIFDDFVHYEKRQEEEDSRKHVVEPRGDSQRGHYGGQRDYQGGRGGGGGYNNGDRPQYNHRGGYGSDNNYNRRPGGEGRGFGGHRDNYEGGGERGSYNNHRDRDNYDNYQPRSFGPPRDDRDNNYRRDYRDNNNYRGGRGGGGNMNGNNNNRGGGRWNTGRDME